MNITRQQFARIAPAATADTLDALFTTSRDGMPIIDRILDEFEIKEPPAVAMFLALCSLASDRFTEFNTPQYGSRSADWLHYMARVFFNLNIIPDANEWDWLTVADTFPAKGFGWLMANNRLSEVCAALGIEDRSEEFAIPEDRGASEM